MERQGDGGVAGPASRLRSERGAAREAAAVGLGARAPEWARCDACGTGMQALGHCKWLCRMCGFMRTCIDTV
jgi:hypothetical protein